MSLTEFIAVSGYETLTALLKARARATPERRVYTYLADGETEADALTYGELWRRSRAVASTLCAQLEPGARVLLLFPAGLDFIVSFLGSLRAGMVAIPAYPPHKRRSHFEKLGLIARNSQAVAILSDDASLTEMGRYLDEAEALANLKRIPLSACRERHTELPQLSANALAFLQYTSGSTGDPKGVMVSHGNIMANEALITKAFAMTEDDVVVGWLPFYHDMGLIGNILQPLFVGAHAVLMPPLAMLQKPLRWLTAISHYRATVSGGPNFAYDLCCQRIDAIARAGLDLSCWRVAFNGSEPIRTRTLDRFSETFGDVGFSPKAHFPCYGMAEATLMVTAAQPFAGAVSQTFESEGIETGQARVTSENARYLTGSGRNDSGETVAIVDPASLRELPQGQVGEIWVQGPSVAGGYWGREELTQHTFAARIEDQAERGEFMRTGDLGFLYDDELYVTGRLVELIIVRGRNYYPQDLEATVQAAHETLAPGSGAAFTVEADGEARLVVVQEVKRTAMRSIEPRTVIDAVRAAVAAEHELQVYVVVLIRPASLPKTTSGKIRRRATRTQFMEDSLSVVGQHAWQPGDGETKRTVVLDAEAVFAASGTRREQLLTRFLGAWLAHRLGGTDEEHLEIAFASLGLDSMSAIELQHLLTSALGLDLPMSRFLGDETPASLAHFLAEQLPAQRPRVAQIEWPDRFPLSHNQRALYFLYGLAPESAAYHICLPLTILGDLDRAALDEALVSLVTRHRQLRAAFGMGPDGPEQHITASPTSLLEVETEPPVDPDTFDTRVRDDASRPFELASGRPLRAKLYARDEGNHLLVLTMHHLVGDMWSLFVLLAELGEYYGAHRRGQKALLAELDSDYADLVTRQATLLAGEEGKRLEAYWDRRFPEPPPTLSLHTDHPRPPQQTWGAVGTDFRLSEKALVGVRTLARSNHTTLFSVLLSAWQVLLSRYTGQQDVVVGAPTSGRLHPNWAPLVGDFVNVLPLRADLAGAPDFQAFLQRQSEQIRADLAHQAMPFQVLVERICKQRDPSISPLYQSMLVYQKPHLLPEAAPFVLGQTHMNFELGGLNLEPFALGELGAQVDLALILVDENGHMGARVTGNRELFEQASLRAVAAHFNHLLEELSEDSGQAITRVPIYNEATRQELLALASAERLDFDRGQTLDRLIGESVTKWPTRTLCCHREQALSYADYGARSHEIAGYLRALGVRVGDRVGVCLPRGLDLMPTLYAIIRLGAAYVPLDPDFPIDRIVDISEDAGCVVLVTVAEVKKNLPAKFVPALLDLADAPTPIQAEYPELTPESYAYILYTSGSTGKPKGVAVTHGNAVNLLRGAEVALRHQTGTWLAVSNATFDVSVLELVLTPIMGFTIIVQDMAGGAWMQPGAQGMADSLQRHEITHLQCTPSLARLMIDVPEVRDQLSSLTVWFLAGEPLSSDLTNRLRTHTNARLINIYGPTEATIWTTWDEVAPDRPVSLGIGVVNYDLIVADRQMEPQPRNLPGELLIGGAGVSSGYLGRPALTAERYVPNPFTGTAGQRLYKSGDLVRRLPDGRLDFLGRIDFQLKLRGYRIELGEIEARLQEREEVAACVVVARSIAGGEPRLLAYLEPVPNSVPDRWDGSPVACPFAGELKAGLAEHLPEYMLPADITMMARLPLNANGKVDRGRLPEPQREEVSSDQSLTATEQIVQRIWGDVLGRETDIDANFFEQGGHSLMAFTAVTRLRAELAMELPLGWVFRYPTARAFAGAVDAARDGKKGAVTIARIADDGRAPLSFAQQRLWFVHTMDRRSPAYNLPATVRLEGVLDVAALSGALREVVARHETLRAIFSEEGGRVDQRFVEAAQFAVQVIDVSGVPTDERVPLIEVLAAREAATAFDLTRNIPLRATLLYAGPGCEQVFLLTLHHIAGDGWSIGIMIRELARGYRARVGETIETVPSLTVRYRDFAAWQQSRQREGHFDRDLRFWQERLKGVPDHLELPGDGDGQESEAGSMLALPFSEGLQERVQDYCRQVGLTPFQALFAVFQALVHKLTEKEDFIVGVAVAGRTHAEIEPLIGCFVNMLPIRCRPRAEATFTEVANATRDETAESFAHQELAFDKLVEALQIPRRGNLQPLIQVAFGYQDDPLLAIELPGVKMHPMISTQAAARYDLTLWVMNQGTRLVGQWTCRHARFSEDAVRQFHTRFMHLCAQVFEQPDITLTRLSLVSEAERNQKQQEAAAAAEKSKRKFVKKRERKGVKLR